MFNTDNCDILLMQQVLDNLVPNDLSTSVHCPACRTRAKIDSKSSKTFFKCHECFKEYTWYNAKHFMLPQFAPMKRIKTCRALTYYHWTVKDDWLTSLPRHRMVHMGAKQTAYERMVDNMKECRLDELSREKLSAKFQQSHVYRLKLNPKTPMYPRILSDDQNHTSSVEPYSKTTQYTEHPKIERYLNVVEASGSISICADKTMFTVEKHLTAAECFGSEVIETSIQKILLLLANRKIFTV